MSKVWNMILIMTGLTLLLKFAGIPTGLDSFFTFLGLQTANGTLAFTGDQSALWIKIGLVLASSIGTAVVIGYFTKASFEWVIVAPFAAATGILFVSTFVSIVNYANNFETWVKYPIFMIFSIIGIGFLWGLLEWVFNRQ